MIALIETEREATLVKKDIKQHKIHTRMRNDVRCMLEVGIIHDSLIANLIYISASQPGCF